MEGSGGLCFCAPVDIRLCLKFGMACVPQLQSFSFTDSQQGSYYLLPRSESGRKNVLFTHLISSRHMQQCLPGHLNSSNLSTNVGFQHSNFPDV